MEEKAADIFDGVSDTAGGIAKRGRELKIASCLSSARK